MLFPFLCYKRRGFSCDIATVRSYLMDFVTSKTFLDSKSLYHFHMMTPSREDTNKEELGKQTLLRGIFEWAPSRPQIIFTLHPSSRRQLTEKQNYRCAGCGIEVAQKYASKFHHCEYLGRYSCTVSHSRRSSTIPSRVLTKWDFSKYPVSDFSYRLLNQLSTDPLFNIIQEIYQKSLKIWSMYADLEESLGTFQSCKAVYDRIIDLKIATPQIIVNYVSFLEDNKYFSLKFQVCSYEKGVSLFKWPNVYDIWKMYVTKFLDHYKGTKISQTRDLFIQCLEHCPPNYAKEFYIMFAKIEETYPNTTSARNILNVYEKAVSAVLPEEKFKMYNTYISKAASVSGIRKIREIYEKAILDLDGNDSRQMCINYAKLETKLGEIERARAIYVQCSQVCDPRVTSDFWEMWSDFEVAHGNEDTLMEMLRIKRSVQTQFNIQRKINVLWLNTTANCFVGKISKFELVKQRIMIDFQYFDVIIIFSIFHHNTYICRRRCTAANKRQHRKHFLYWSED
ncbi:hypothetical protein PGB90_008660 [Kerria lacca]